MYKMVTVKEWPDGTVQLLSWMERVLPDDWVVEYLPREFVSGPAPLFVQITDPRLDTAYLMPRTEVWRVSVINPRHISNLCADYYNAPSLEDFWADPEGSKWSAPSSLNMIADQVRLDERVWWPEEKANELL